MVRSRTYILGSSTKDAQTLDFIKKKKKEKKEKKKKKELTRLPVKIGVARGSEDEIFGSNTNQIGTLQ